MGRLAQTLGRTQTAVARQSQRSLPHVPRKHSKPESSGSGGEGHAHLDQGLAPVSDSPSNKPGIIVVKLLQTANPVILGVVRGGTGKPDLHAVPLHGAHGEMLRRPHKPLSVALSYAVMPNTSLEARLNIKTPGPRSGLAHFPPRGPGVLLSVPPQLER